MKKPETWKDYFKNKKNNNNTNHSWIICGGRGKRNVRTLIRTLSGECFYEPIYILYKCKKCKITAKKYISGELIVEDKYRNLTCNEIIIKSIIE